MRGREPDLALRLLLHRFEDRCDLLLVEGLLLEQLEHQVVEHVAVVDQDLPRLVVRGLDQPAHLLVDDLGDPLGVVALVTHVAPEERARRAPAQPDRADAGAHAVLRDHRAGDRGGLLDVVGRTRRRVVEDQLLGDAAAEHVGQLVEHLVAGRGVLVLVGQHHRVAEGAAARQDRHLVHRVGVGQRRRDQGVPALVVGGDLLLLVVHDPGALLRPGDDAVDGLVEQRRCR